MKLLGLEITRQELPSVTKALAPAGQSLPAYSWLNYWGTNLWQGIRESFAGAWQRNITLDPDTSLLAFSAVFACVTGIASDIAKMRIKLSENENGIWTEITASQPWLKVLRRPNHYQTRIKFVEQWIVSKLLYGNSYILKKRADKRGIVTELYVLHPQRVTPLVTEDGDVYYRISKDTLSRVEEESVVVPASEIIHDMMVALWHPLVGVPPIYACGRSATMGNRIQTNSTKFFNNMSMPSLFLSAPMHINDDTAKRLKEHFETNYSGDNIGRVAVGGDGLKLEAFTIPAEEAQLIEQLKWTVEDVGRAFRYPAWKMGGAYPTYAQSPEAIMMAYYTDCLHPLIESMELCLDEGLELPTNIGTEFDLDTLLRMDTGALYESLVKAKPFMKLDEQRFRANMKPLPKGGNTVYLQQQDYSVEALADRDANDPFKKETPPPPQPAPQPAPAPAPETPPPAAKGIDPDDLDFFESELRKELILA